LVKSKKGESLWGDWMWFTSCKECTLAC
jgi:hypothetical protein